MSDTSVMFKGESYEEHENPIVSYACEEEESCGFYVSVEDLESEGLSESGVDRCPDCGSDVSEASDYAGLDCDECGTYLDVESVVYVSGSGRKVCSGCMPA